MDTIFFVCLIFISWALSDANYCYYSYYYSNYYCSNNNNTYLDSRSIAGIVVGCVVTIVVIVALVVYCKKKDKRSTRVVEIRSNGATQIHTMTTVHPPPAPPGRYPNMVPPPAYGARPAYPSVNMYPPPARPPLNQQFGVLPGGVGGPPPSVFPPAGPVQHPAMPPPSC